MKVRRGDNSLLHIDMTCLDNDCISSDEFSLLFMETFDFAKCRNNKQRKLPIRKLNEMASFNLFEHVELTVSCDYSMQTATLKIPPPRYRS